MDMFGYKPTRDIMKKSEPPPVHKIVYMVQCRSLRKLQMCRDAGVSYCDSDPMSSVRFPK